MSLRSFRCAPLGGGEVLHATALRRACVWVLVAFLFLGPVFSARGQHQGMQPMRRTQSRPTLIILGGVAQPFAHESVTDFWLRGPAAALAFTIDVQHWLALGLEISGAQFYFDKMAFGTRYPGVANDGQNAAQFDALLLMKVLMAPRMIFAPYLTFGLGATHWTGASAKEEIPGQPRQVYYDIPRKTRLAAAVALGADFVMWSRVALVLEVRASSAINDPELGLVGAARGGVRLRL